MSYICCRKYPKDIYIYIYIYIYRERERERVIKFIDDAMKNLRMELTEGGKRLAEFENPERNLPERCAITINICKSDNANESHT